MSNCPAPACCPSKEAPRACRGDPLLSPFLFALLLAAAPPPPDPFPPPDPALWWSEAWPAAPEAADPLGQRTARRNERPPEIDNGVDPLLYRLWSLPPLQTMLVRRDEMVLEVWARPTGSVRQTVIRIVLRGDGKAFVQGRAGMGCCEPRIGRLVAFDEPLQTDSIAAFRALAEHPMWSQPRQIELQEPDGSASALCVDGVAWDVTLVTPGRSRHLHRACLDEATGSVADALAPAVAAALGQDPRFDLLFPRGADFSRDKAAYAALLARGGRLKPARTDRPQPPLTPVPPDEEPAATP
ncbi:MAG: hypothetical protein Q7U20_06210 [Caulobacter sp.]|nr:hypothetical protein [Caulobacter sp.]